MAQKDVELRLRARDDASKNVKKVSESLKAIEADAANAAKGAGKAGTALGSLAADVNRLQTEANKLKSFGNIASQLDKTTAAVERSERAILGAQAAFTRLAAESNTAASATAALKAQTEAQAAALEREKAALAATRAEQTKANAVVRQAEKDQLALNAARSQRTAGNRASPGVGLEAGAAASSARASMGAFVEADLANARARQAQVNAEVKNYAAAVKSSTAALKESQTQTRAAGREQKALADQVERAGNALLAARADAAANWRELERIDAAATKASASLGGLSMRQEDIARASQRAADQLARQQRALEAYNKFSTGGTQFADPKTAAVFQRQSEAVKVAKADLAALRDETTRLGREFSRSSGNVTKQVDDLNRMAAATRAAEAEVQKQVAAMNRLRGVTQGGGYGAWAKANVPLQQTTAAVVGATTATTRLTKEQQRLAPATQRSAGAMRGAAGAANQMGSAIRTSYSDKRQSLSITQRLRGEVLALATAYLGLQSAIGGIKNSLGAFMALEAVQSRLGAVFAQDTAKVASEVDFLRGQADRLGISFSVLGQQYGKFAVAANAANFSAANTRDIFLSVAEAGRVNKLSLDQLNGTFLAIEQIISKGKFTSEEVRRQLGDRLPGAFNILADAMGITTMELDRMMAAGELLSTEDNLMKFADEMKRRFGPQLSDSLNTATTDIGRFENNLFKIQLALSTGFIPELRKALQAFNDFASSAEGAQTFAQIGATVGKLIGVLALVPQYLNEILLFFKAIAVFQLAKVFVNIAQRVVAARAAFVGLGQTMAFIGPQMQQMTVMQRVVGQGFAQLIGTIDTYRARLLASTSTTNTARFGTMAFAATLGGLRTAMMLTANAARVMWLAIGGLPGLIATGIVFAVGSWMTSIDDATSALVEHERQINAAREAYQMAAEGAEDWAKSVKGVSLPGAVGSLKDLMNELDEMRRPVAVAVASPLGGTIALLRGEMGEAGRLIGQLTEQMFNAEISAMDYAKALDEIYRSTDDEAIRAVIEAAQEQIRTFTRQEEAIRRQARLVKLLGGDLEDLAGYTGDVADENDTLGESVYGVTRAFDRAAAIKTYTDSIETLKGAIPELAEEMKRLKDITDLNKVAWEGMMAAVQAGDYSKIMEIFSLLARATLEINNSAISGAVGGSLVDRIVGVESGGNPNAKNPMSSATGLGQFIDSTWLSMFKKYFPDRAASLSDAMILELRKNADLSRQMVELYAQENAAFLQRLGIKLNDGNLYLAHFLGPQGAADILRADRDTPVELILSAAQINANQSILAGKTAGQVSNWAQQKMGGSDTEIAARQTLAKLDKEAAEEAAKQAEATKRRIADTEFEIGQQMLINDGKAKQAAIEEAVRAAREENPNISEDELEMIRQQTAALYEQQNAREGIEAVEERVNQLQAIRQSLLEQQRMAEESGDYNRAAEVKTEIEGINEQLEIAIERAIAMWTAIGGPEADVAIAKLQTAGMALEHNNNKIIAFGLNASQISTLVGSAVDGIVGIFDNMAQAIAKGENAVKAMGTAFLQFAADFLRQIAMMILKQMLLNALAGFGGPIGQAAAGLGGIAGHTGGLVGAHSIGGGNPIGARPQWAQSAFTYHTGGLAGFRPDEVSATLKRNEEVLTEEDPRHRFNMGGESEGGGRDRGIKQVLAVGDDEIANAMSGGAGERIIVTHIKRNAATLRQILK